MSIRVVNLKSYNLNEGEVLIRVDRGTPLGNPFKMNDESERDSVISDYSLYFFESIANKDEAILAELRKIYNTALKYNVALGCWCYPNKCHAEIIKNYLDKFLNNKSNTKKEGKVIDYTNTVSFTGHRPDKFAFKYNEADDRCTALKDRLKEVIVSCIKRGYTHFITGMALGVDTWAAEICLELRDAGSKITVEAAVPCLNHSSKWFKASRERYDALLKRMDKVTLVTNAPYSAKLMQLRNEYMVNNSKLQIAVWDGSQGGTFNAVNYAKSKDKFIMVIDPNSLGLRVWRPENK